MISLMIIALFIVFSLSMLGSFYMGIKFGRGQVPFKDEKWPEVYDIEDQANKAQPPEELLAEEDDGEEIR